MQLSAVIFLAATMVAPATWAETPAEWHPRAAEICLLPPYDAPATPEQQALAELLAALDDWPEAPGALTAPLRADGIALCLDDRPSFTRGVYEVDFGLVALSARLSPGERLAILIHELRHVDQRARGFCPSLAYGVEAATAFTFAVEADAQAVSSYVAWTLAAAGRPEAWEALLGMSNYADIAHALDGELTAYATVPEALARAFARWYEAPWRVSAYARAACEGHYDALDRTHLLPSYGALPEGHLDGLCTLPGGGFYDCEIPRAANAVDGASPPED